MTKFVKLKHKSGSTLIDLTKVIAASYCETADLTEIYLEGGYEITIPGNYFNHLCSLIAMVEAEDE